MSYLLRVLLSHFLVTFFCSFLRFFASIYSRFVAIWMGGVSTWFCHKAQLTK